MDVRFKHLTAKSKVDQTGQKEGQRKDAQQLLTVQLLMVSEGKRGFLLVWNKAALSAEKKEEVS